MTTQTVKIRLVRSPIGISNRTVTQCVAGLRKLAASGTLDTLVRGMINKISYLVKSSERLMMELVASNGRRCEARQAPRRRGIGSGLGKTAGRGHKGEIRSGGYHKVSFEGGQMPLQRRLLKRFQVPVAEIQRRSHSAHSGAAGSGGSRYDSSQAGRSRICHGPGGKSDQAR